MGYPAIAFLRKGAAHSLTLYYIAKLLFKNRRVSDDVSDHPVTPFYIKVITLLRLPSLRHLSSSMTCAHRQV